MADSGVDDCFFVISKSLDRSFSTFSELASAATLNNTCALIEDRVLPFVKQMAASLTVQYSRNAHATFAKSDSVDDEFTAALLSAIGGTGVVLVALDQ